MLEFQTGIPHHESVFPRDDEFPPSSEKGPELSLISRLARCTRERWLKTNPVVKGAVLGGGLIGAPMGLIFSMPGESLVLPIAIGIVVGAISAKVVFRDRPLPSARQ